MVMGSNDGGGGDTMPVASEGTDAGEEDSDADGETHDFDWNGVLPDALTALHSVKSPNQRAAQLAADCNKVGTVLGMSDIQRRYPRRLHFLHTPDCSGDSTTTSAFVLLPTENEPGVNLQSLLESKMLRRYVSERSCPDDVCNSFGKASRSKRGALC